MKSLLPTDPNDQFYLGLFAAHGLAAVASGIMSMYCEVSFASQQAMRVVPVQNNASRARNSEAVLFMGATPWSEDGQFESHRWNPYILVLAFQWLTAWFAFCNIRHWHEPKEIKGWAIAGVILGLVVIAVWAVLPNPRSQEQCLAMYILLLLSFIAAPLAFSRYFWIVEQEELALLMDQPPGQEEQEQEQDSRNQEQQTQWEQFQTPDDEPGQGPEGTPNNAAGPRRMWNIPKRIAMLKNACSTGNGAHVTVAERQRLLTTPMASLRGALTPEQEAVKKEILFRRAIDAVGFRYAEYCITAPLLFLAVMCLLVTDAPAWLFLAGYWLIQACNAVGIALHYNITGDVGERVANKGAAGKWFKDLISEGIWGDHNIQYAWLLCVSWLCLMVPLGGLVYAVRHWIFNISSGEMPWIALAMVWLLLLAYSMFALLPTAIYLDRTEEAIIALPWILDVLNLLAKLPVPILIIIAFATRPAGFHACQP